MEDNKKKLKEELEHTKELTEIEKKEQEIKDKLSDIVADDKNEVTKGSKESDLLADPVYWKPLPLYKSEKRKQSD